MESPLLSDYIYDLPDEQIARYPVTPRDSSRSLFFNKGVIEHRQFKELPNMLPEGGLLVLNNSKVVPARLIFTKDTGATIEVFLTEPHTPALVPQAMESKGTCTWHCMVGNKKRWKEEGSLSLVINEALTLQAHWHNREQGIVNFNWNTDLSFAEVIELCGRIPLPPYLARDAEEADKDTYQTVYSKEKGAVAAPTAGLHFTDDTFKQLANKGINAEYLTLHVSAGTFKPVSAENVLDHDMHSEQLVVSKTNVEHLLDKVDKLVAVGTTSMRVMESLYWFGVRLLNKEANPYFVPKLYAYQHTEAELPSAAGSLQAILDDLQTQNADKLMGSTEIFIVPGYRFRMCSGLVTNFHQPGSTLLMLVSAFIGDNNRKRIYNEALQQGYRFLSYGDSSLLLP